MGMMGPRFLQALQLEINGNHDEAGKGQSQSFQDILHMFMFIHFLIRISQNYRFLASPLRAGTDLVGT